MKKIKLNLSYIDGNAFSILGAFQKQAHIECWTKEEIAEVLNEAKSSNYIHLCNTIANRCESYDDIKNCRVAWVPKKGQILSEIGVKNAGGYFIDGWFTYEKAGMIAADFSFNNDASGDYIAVYFLEGAS